MSAILLLAALTTADAASVAGAVGFVGASPAVGVTVEGSSGSRWKLDREVGVWVTGAFGEPSLLGGVTGNLALTRAFEIGQRSTLGPSVAADLGVFSSTVFYMELDDGGFDGGGFGGGCAQPPCYERAPRRAPEEATELSTTRALDLAAGATWGRVHPDGSGKRFELSLMLQPTTSYGPEIVLPRLDMSWTTRRARHVGVKAYRHATFFEWGRAF